MKDPDDKPLSDNEVDDRLKTALATLGDAPGATTAGNAALKAARQALAMLSLGLIKSGLKRDAATDPPAPAPEP